MRNVASAASRSPADTERDAGAASESRGVSPLSAANESSYAATLVLRAGSGELVVRSRRGGPNVRRCGRSQPFPSVGARGRGAARRWWLFGTDSVRLSAFPPFRLCRSAVSRPARPDVCRVGACGCIRCVCVRARLIEANPTDPSLLFIFVCLFDVLEVPYQGEASHLWGRSSLLVWPEKHPDRSV